MTAFEDVKWGKGRKAEFSRWITEELNNTLSDRLPLERKWRDQIIQWRARHMGDGTSDVPFIGASDLELPLTAMHTDPVYSDFMQSLHAPPNFWSARAKRPALVDRQNAIEEFIANVERDFIKMRKVDEVALMDLVIHGTCIFRDDILHEIKKVQRYDLAGAVVTRAQSRFRPIVERVPLQNFFIPAYALSIDPDAMGGAPWVAERMRLTEAQFLLKARNSSPYYPSYKKSETELVRQFVWSDLEEDTILATHRKEDEYVPYKDNKVTVYRIHARFDADGDEVEEDLIVDYHLPTQTVLRATFNYFMHGKRPFSVGKYMPGQGFYGMGIAELDQWAQTATSRLLNSLIDNASLSNTVMLGVPEGMNISPDEPFYAGRLLPTPAGESIQPIQLGRPYNGMFQLIDSTIQWSEQRVGVPELRQGDISNLPSRTPASVVLNALNEGNKRFDMILGNFRSGPGEEIGLRLLQNIIQISKDDARWKEYATSTLGEKDGAMVVELLDGDVFDVGSRFGISLTATNSQINKVAQRQDLVFLQQSMSQSYQQSFQWAQMLAQSNQDPETLLAVAESAFNGTVELQRRLLEAHDIQNVDRYTPPLTSATPSQPQPGQPAQPGLTPEQPEVANAFGLLNFPGASLQSQLGTR